MPEEKKSATLEVVTAVIRNAGSIVHRLAATTHGNYTFEAGEVAPVPEPIAMRLLLDHESIELVESSNAFADELKQAKKQRDAAAKSRGEALARARKEQEEAEKATAKAREAIG